MTRRTGSDGTGARGGRDAAGTRRAGGRPAGCDPDPAARGRSPCSPCSRWPPAPTGRRRRRRRGAAVVVPAGALPPAGGLVLLVEHTGGFVTPDTTASRLPLVSVYSDGRVVTEGPVIAIYPGPALPNVQVTPVPRRPCSSWPSRPWRPGSRRPATSARRRSRTRRPPASRWSPPRAPTCARSTPSPSAGLEGDDDGLTAEQRAGRAALQELLDALTATTDAAAESYAPRRGRGDPPVDRRRRRPGAAAARRHLARAGAPRGAAGGRARAVLPDRDRHRRPPVLEAGPARTHAPPGSRPTAPAGR